MVWVVVGAFRGKFKNLVVAIGNLTRCEFTYFLLYPIMYPIMFIFILHARSLDKKILVPFIETVSNIVHIHDNMYR